MDDTDQYIESMGKCDFYIVFVNDKKVGCGCFRTKEGLAAFLKKYPEGCAEKVDVLTCDWDD